MPLSRGETFATGKSSSSTSMGALTTPLTSPSESASPICEPSSQMTKEVSERMLAFQSDPSLPALLSSTSSVSADPEGEFLGNPGVVSGASVIDTTDSLTPPALAKEPGSGFPLDAHDVPEGAVPVKLDHAAAAPRPAGGPPATNRRGSRNHADDDEDNGSSDSDEGLTMAKRKRPIVPPQASSPEPRDAHAQPQSQSQSQWQSTGRLMGNARRRDTNISVGSTETAKKLVVDSD
jgi:[calcium/calmodulin-dependent protein kinase] kinase